MLSTTRQEDAKRSAADNGMLSAICKAAADPLRLDVMRVLSNDSFGVQELAAIFSMAQPGMSHHLKILATSGLLVTRRQGNSIFYRRALLKGDAELDEFQTSLFQVIDSLPLAKEFTAKISRIYAERAERSRHYFEKNAAKFEEQQGLLCEVGQYLPNLTEILDLLDLPADAKVMEVGPGQGVVLKELAARFKKLVALDNSEEMLSLAKAKVWAKDGIEFVHGSLESFDAKGKRFDAILLNMVLHHMPSPVQALQKLRALVAPGRYLLIADLCSHNQEWTKDSCGDVWLGFDPQDLKDWALNAGFAEDQSLYLGLKNGFQIQLKLFHAI